MSVVEVVVHAPSFLANAFPVLTYNLVLMIRE